MMRAQKIATDKQVSAHYIYCLYRIEWSVYRGVARIWQGGARIFFSEFEICMSQSALLGGFGACPPEKIV